MMVVQAVEVRPFREFVLELPHLLVPGEMAFLVVETGALGRAPVELATADGRALGLISAYGGRSGEGGGTYTVPVPAEAFHEGRLVLRVSIPVGVGQRRAPTANEVLSVRLMVVPSAGKGGG